MQTRMFLAIMSTAINRNKGNNKGIIIVIKPEIINNVGATRLPRFRIVLTKDFYSNTL